jgi:hypothetical protein
MVELLPDLRRIFFQRFSRGAWLQESAIIDDPGGMRYAVGGRVSAHLVGGHGSAARRLAGCGHVSEYLGPAYAVPLRCCVLAIDRSGTYRRLQGRIIHARRTGRPEGYERDGFTEPAFTRLRDGSLYCVLRTTDGNGVGPMYRTRSLDGGRTWSKPAVMAKNGVMPRLLRLGNGMLLLSSGRPGVQLRISKSGLGDDWSEPVDVLPPTSDKLDVDSCGYTGLVALDRDTFLIVYSWFQSGCRRAPTAVPRAKYVGHAVPSPQCWGEKAATPTALRFRCRKIACDSLQRSREACWCHGRGP